VGVDDRVRRALRDVPPADPTGAYERIVEKRVRRGVTRKIQTAALVVVVVLGSAGGFVALVRGFTGGPQPGAGVRNGLIAFTDIRTNGFGPDGARIEDDWHIYTMNPDGRSTARLGPDSVDEALYPTWSPDGSQLAFLGYAGKRARSAIYVMDADGRNVHPIYEVGDDQQVEGLRWSPDGGRIGFQLKAARGSDGGSWQPARWTIWSLSTDGNDVRQITTSGREMHFSWSPDGRQIVFDRFTPFLDTPEGRSLASAEADLFVVNSDGSNERRLTDDGISRDPAWSPDGATVAFLYGEHGDQRVATIRTDGTDRRVLVATPVMEGGISFPYGNAVVWSPDGTMVAYSGHDDHDVCSISVVDVETGSVRRLIETPARQACPGQEGMSWGVAGAGWASEPTPVGATPAPNHAASPVAPSGRDIGLAFRLCHLETLTGIDLASDGTEGTAWTGLPVKDAGECIDRTKDSYVVAVDVDGDGRADDAWSALEYCLECRPYAAADLDGDGVDELIVLESGGSTPRYELFEVRTSPDGSRLRPIVVGTEAAPRDGFPAGDPVRLVVGGDEGFSGFVGCKGYPDRPEIFVGWADGPVDGPGSDVREVHLVRFVVEDGRARVLDAEAFTRPTGETLPYPFGTDNVACGVNWNPA
jgi:WD40 repeat protein